MGESRNEHAGGIDVLGLVLFSAALAALVFGLIRGNDEGFTSPLILTLLIGSAVLLVAFVFVQRTAEHPTFDLSLFRVPTFVGGLIAAFVLSAAMFACFLYLTLYMQNQLGYTALEAGVRFLPISLLSFVVAPISGKLAERLGVRWFIGAGLLFVAGALFSFSWLDVGDDWTALLPGMILGGIGIGMVNAPLATTAVGVVEPQRAGVASGINSTARQVGIATGTAVYGAIAAGVIDGRAPELRAGRRRPHPAGRGRLVQRLHPVRRLRAAGRAGDRARPRRLHRRARPAPGGRQRRRPGRRRPVLRADPAARLRRPRVGLELVVEPDAVGAVGVDRHAARAADRRELAGAARRDDQEVLVRPVGAAGARRVRVVERAGVSVE